MPITTDYLKINKPLYTEAADIEVINENMDIIHGIGILQCDNIKILSDPKEGHR